MLWALVASISAGTLSFLAALAGQYTLLRHGASRGETPQDRIRALSSVLAESAVVIEAMQKEIEARKELVSKLEKDARTYEQAAALNRTQVEAVAQLLRGELRVGERRSLTWSIAINFIFFLFGILISVLLR
jgi:hypothetical protein